MCLEQVESFSCFYSPNNTVLTPTYIWFTLHWTFKQPGVYLSHSVGCLHVLCKWYPLLYKRFEHHWVLVSRREAWKQLPDSEYERTAPWPWLITAHGLYSFPVHCLIFPKQSLWTIEWTYSLLHFIDRKIEALLIVICTMSHSTGETGQAWTLTPIPRTRALSLGCFLFQHAASFTNLSTGCKACLEWATQAGTFLYILQKGRPYACWGCGWLKNQPFVVCFLREERLPYSPPSMFYLLGLLSARPCEQLLPEEFKHPQTATSSRTFNSRPVALYVCCSDQQPQQYPVLTRHPVSQAP